MLKALYFSSVIGFEEKKNRKKIGIKKLGAKLFSVVKITVQHWDTNHF